jgi:hypothetical protein
VKALPLVRFAASLLVVLLPLAAAAQTSARGEQLAPLRLPLLAERIAKLHAQAGLGILAAKSRRALGDTLRDFDTTLRASAAGATTAEARDNYALLALLWPEYREWALRTPTRESARKLRERNEEVVWVASKGARMLQGESRAAASAAMVRALQAGLLAQRIAKLVLWRRWDLRDEALARELREARENLPRALDALGPTPGASAEDNAEIQLAQNQWRFMDDALRGAGAGAGEGDARELESIAKTGDNILESMERLARLYAAGK